MKVPGGPFTLTIRRGEKRPTERRPLEMRGLFIVGRKLQCLTSEGRSARCLPRRFEALSQGPRIVVS
jgi:hypothetical protein